MSGSRLSPREAARAGIVAIAPVLLGVVPFGIIAGIAPLEADLGAAAGIGFSVVLFAGASQLAAIELLGDGANVAIAIGTAIIINLRFAMYSASLAPHLAEEPAGRRAAGAYFLGDQAYAVCIVRYRDGVFGRSERWWFYVGAALAMWVTWQLSTVLGMVLGGSVPDAIPLGFAVPLAFLSLMMPNVTDRPTVAAAVVGAIVAVVAAPLPANLGMPVGATSGVVVGWALARRQTR